MRSVKVRGCLKAEHGLCTDLTRIENAVHVFVDLI